MRIFEIHTIFAMRTQVYSRCCILCRMASYREDYVHCVMLYNTVEVWSSIWLHISVYVPSSGDGPWTTGSEMRRSSLTLY